MRDNAYSKMIIVLIGNKDDLKLEREVSTEEGQEFADKHNLLFMETSAKTGHNIESAFVQSANLINENIKVGQYDLRTENIGIKPGNMFKASFDNQTKQIKPNNLLT
jgi:Ras-related protein Rab-2A